MITFFFGLMVGVLVGVLVASVCAISGRISQEELPDLDTPVTR